MESYIVRIYRREEQDNSPIRGLVEKVGAVGQDAFGTMEELWNILSFVKRPGRREKKPGLRGYSQKKKQDNTE